jgi:hypothetical protein
LYPGQPGAALEHLYALTERLAVESGASRDHAPDVRQSRPLEGEFTIDIRAQQAHWLASQQLAGVFDDPLESIRLHLPPFSAGGVAWECSRHHG